MRVFCLLVLFLIYWDRKGLFWMEFLAVWIKSGCSSWSPQIEWAWVGKCEEKIKSKELFWDPGSSCTWSQCISELFCMWVLQIQVLALACLSCCLSFVTKRALAKIPSGSFILQTKIRKWLTQGPITRDTPGSASKPPEVHSRTHSQLF